MIHFTESDLIAADDAERHNTCPFCGGYATRFRYSLNRCDRCYLPVVFWHPWWEMQARIEAITAERDLAVKWLMAIRAEAIYPATSDSCKPDILTMIRSTVAAQRGEGTTIESVIEELGGEL